MIYLDKLGWPVETIKGRPVLNFIRRLIHTRKIVRHWAPREYSSPMEGCSQGPAQQGGKNDE